MVGYHSFAETGQSSVKDSLNGTDWGEGGGGCSWLKWLIILDQIYTIPNNLKHSNVSLKKSTKSSWIMLPFFSYKDAQEYLAHPGLQS